jgi:glycolate oxidase
VPRSKLGAILAVIEEIGRRRGLAVAVVAHAGDGNLHPSFSVPKDPADGGVPPESLLAAADELVRAALGFGGTISGEHGVGITKRSWLELELGAPNLALQRKVKAAFDPRGLLNPHTWLAKDRPAGVLESVRTSRQRSGSPLPANPHARVPDAYGTDRSWKTGRQL